MILILFRFLKIHFGGCRWGAQNRDSRKGFAWRFMPKMHNAENGEKWTKLKARSRKLCFAEARRLSLMAAEGNGNSKEAKM